MAKAKGIALHIGLNTVDPDHYQGWDGQLFGCENDAHDMAAISEAAGFEHSMLLTSAATADAVEAAIGDTASKLVENDVFLLTYSGHGGQMPDSTSDEDDARDETWVLFDRQYLDDELYQCWSKFEPGVSIVVFSDSCHSGTAVRVAPGEVNKHAPRTMPKAQALKVYEANKSRYDEIQRAVPSSDAVEVGARVLLISGCQDDQTSADGEKNGLFTQTMLGVWNEGEFKGGYKGFYDQIVEKMPQWQRPNWLTVGASGAGFSRRKPFKI
jgi:metacaspase-1